MTGESITHMGGNVQKEPLLTFRQAGIDDVPALVLVDDQASARRAGEEIPAEPINPHEIERLRELIPKPATWSRLAFDGEQLAGFILGYRGKDPDTQQEVAGRQHISLLMVHPDYWSQGIGGTLLDWAADEMRAGGDKELSLWTGVDNERARSLYERKGFKLTDKTRICPDPLNPEPQVQYLKTL